MAVRAALLSAVVLALASAVVQAGLYKEYTSEECLSQVADWLYYGEHDLADVRDWLKAIDHSDRAAALQYNHLDTHYAGGAIPESLCEKIRDTYRSAEENCFCSLEHIDLSEFDIHSSPMSGEHLQTLIFGDMACKQAGRY